MDPMELERIPSVLPYAFAAMAVILGLIFFIKALSARLKRPAGVEEEDLADDQPISVRRPVEQEQEDQWPKCVCGQNATHAAPTLVRSRTGWVRDFFAGAPSYRRRVGSPQRMDEYVFCETHAHVADAMMDRFIYERIRAVQAEANERISIEASAFEKEGLVLLIQNTLEERRRKLSEPPKPNGIRLLGTGTDG